jgi:hypothetical protein
VAGVTTLRFRGDRTLLVQLNDTCHLARAGLPSRPWAAGCAASPLTAMPLPVRRPAPAC